MMITTLKILVFTLWVFVMGQLFYAQLKWYIRPFDAVPINSYLIGWGLYTTTMIGLAWVLIFGINWREVIKIHNSY